MPLLSLLILILLFFATSVIGVVTGSNSLITVPVMFQFGIDPKVAVATNMFGLVFMAVGGSIPFVRAGHIEYKRVRPLVVLTVVSSALGAALVGLITAPGIKLIVSVAMIVVAVFVVARERFSLRPVPRGPQAGGATETALRFPQSRHDTPPTTAPGVEQSREADRTPWLAFALTFLLGIYGGLYSGGYVTMLTAALVAFYGLSYARSIAATKIINVFSSLVATLVFMWQGLVDYRLGLILGVTMFVGAYAGAHYAARMNEVWLRRIFLSTVLILAVKTLYDLLIG